MFDERHIMKKLIVLTGILLFMVHPEPCFAGVVPADSVRTAVITAIEKFAYENSLDIEVSVPVASNILVSDVESPRLRVGIPDVKTSTPNCRVPVDVVGDDGSTVRSLTIIARIRRYEVVAVAAADKKRDEAFTSDDYVFEDTIVTGFSGYFTDPASLEGRQAKRNIRAGTVLTDSNTEPVPIIRRGEKVIMKARVGSVVITAEGVAREDGGLNEIIRVYNDTTKKTLEGRIVDTKTVMIGG